jgi:hypothetical protein
MLREGWHHRVVPVTTLVAGLVALLAVLVPGVRDQIALSATHEPQEYVALSFGRTARDTVVTCTTTGAQVRVAFVVTSALSETRTLDYALTVGARRTTGSMTVEPGESADVTRLVPLPRTKRYDVEVRVEDRRILAHCGAAS